jgi:hypothetical protein
MYFHTWSTEYQIAFFWVVSLCRRRQSRKSVQNVDGHLQVHRTSPMRRLNFTVTAVIASNTEPITHINIILSHHRRV